MTLLDLWDKLDNMTDAVVPAMVTALQTVGIYATIEDQEAISDWLWNRFKDDIEIAEAAKNDANEQDANE